MSLTNENASALPPSDRDEETVNLARVAECAGLIDTELRDQVKALITQEFTQSDLARQVGVSPTYVSRYLAGSFVGDVGRLEFALRYFLENKDQRIDLRRGLQPTGLTKRMAKIIASVQNTSDLAGIYGRAGIGKTCGVRLFAAANPMCAVITAGEGNSGRHDLERELWRVSHVRLRKSQGETNLSRNRILVDRFKGSNRLLLIDNGHLLTSSGFRWCMTFHDDTECPVCLIGNPSMVEKIVRLFDEDQLTSRIGQWRQVKLDEKANEAEELAALLLAQYAPSLAKELMGLATEVCRRRGFARRLKKQIRLCLEILDGGLPAANESVKKLRAEQMTDAQIAFKLAATQLLSLEDEP